MSHIDEEALKAVVASPTITNGNSSTAVVNVIGTIGAVTTTVHVFPSSMFGSLGKAMFDISDSRAAAAPRGAVHQIPRLNVLDCATNTFACPQRLPATAGY